MYGISISLPFLLFITQTSFAPGVSISTISPKDSLFSSNTSQPIISWK